MDEQEGLSANVGGTRRALVADDDADMRHLVAYQVRRAGYEVMEVGDGVELLEAIEAASNNGCGAHSAIVADINMPRITGLEALAALPPELRGTVILITAYGDPITHAKARDLGAFAVLDKPFTGQDLHAVLRRLPGA